MSRPVSPVAVVPTLRSVGLPRGRSCPTLSLPPWAPASRGAPAGWWKARGPRPRLPARPRPQPAPKRAISSLRSQPLHCPLPVVCTWSVLPPVRGAQHHLTMAEGEYQSQGCRRRAGAPGSRGQSSLPSLGGPTGAVGDQDPAGLSS